MSLHNPNLLLNLEVSSHSPPNKNNEQKKVNKNYYIKPTHLQKIFGFLNCQILSFRSGKLSLRKKLLMMRALVRYPFKHEHNAREMYVAKKNKKIITFHNKAKLTQWRNHERPYQWKSRWLKVTKFCLSDENSHRRKLMLTKF